MGKTMDEIYADIIAQNADEMFPITMGRNYDPMTDDSESFITSEDIEKEKKRQQEELDEHGYRKIPLGDGKIEEELHFKRYGRKRKHRYTEQEMEEIRRSCEGTIVHDYGVYDLYHLSDEERIRNDMLASITMKLGGLKRTYRKVDQYVEAMRVVVQAWELLSEMNYIHSDEEFFDLIGKGRIVSNRIIMPKLKNANLYNKDTIIKYISNPELDPADLLPMKVEEPDPWLDDIDENEKETLEEQMRRLLTPEEVEMLLNEESAPPKIRVETIPRKYIKGYDQRSFGKQKKKGNKKTRYFISNLHDLLKKIQTNQSSRSDGYTRSYLVANGLFSVEKPQKDFWDNLYFDGSWVDDDAAFLLDMAINQEIADQKPSQSTYMTYMDQHLKEFFDVLEKNGVNTIDLRRKMNVTSEAMTRSEAKASRKKSRKIESAIIQRITGLNNSPKFKKLIKKAEEAINESYEEN